MSGDAIGMMEGAFFVGRGELLEWANTLLSLSLTKIEQCATGAVYCQIMDAIYPGTFSMAKLKWNAKTDYEYIENYKILQQAFAKNDVKRHIEVDKLVKARYQDNLEFMQWLKRYFDLNYNGEYYDAVTRRKGQDLYYIAGGNKVNGPAKGAQPKPAARPMGGAAPKTSAPKTSNTGPKPSVGGGAGNAQMQAQLNEMKMNMDTLEKERDFYFGKLRDIEMLLQAKQEEVGAISETILKILYASEEEKITVGDNGEVTITPLNGEAENADDMLADEEMKMQ